MVGEGTKRSDYVARRALDLQVGLPATSVHTLPAVQVGEHVGAPCPAVRWSQWWNRR